MRLGSTEAWYRIGVAGVSISSLLPRNESGILEEKGPRFIQSFIRRKFSALARLAHARGTEP